MGKGKTMQKYDFMRVKSAQNKQYSTKWIVNRYGYSTSTVNNMKRCKTFAEYKKRFCGRKDKTATKAPRKPVAKQTRRKTPNFDVVVIKKDSAVETFAAVMAAIAGAAIILIATLLFLGAF